LALLPGATLTLLGVLMGRACELNTNPDNWGCVIAETFGYFVLLAGGLVTAFATVLLLFEMRSWAARAAIGAALLAIGALAIRLGPDAPLCEDGLECAVPGAIGPGILCVGAALLLVAVTGVIAERACRPPR
jgi:hypothetical protein